jgi:hypothetical protein
VWRPRTNRRIIGVVARCQGRHYCSVPCTVRADRITSRRKNNWGFGTSRRELGTVATGQRRESSVFRGRGRARGKRLLFLGFGSRRDGSRWIGFLTVADAWRRYMSMPGWRRLLGARSFPHARHPRNQRGSIT